ncbi:Uma2 family endonuclease [Nocardia sp. NPDC046473]|uniref:Uma2 family endonuclease n=1 Tax=Nocardia sp. NPDC046473 TaxID=3155733 RepID=UPI00341017D6
MAMLPHYGGLPHHGGYAPDGLTVADVRAGYDPGFRYELEDGVAVMMASASMWHNRVLRRLTVAMEALCPVDLSVEMEQSIELADDFAPIPDILVIESAAANPAENVLPKEAVRLAVEIVSPGTRRKDRWIRPMDYAAAGIPNYWRIESENFEPVVYAFQLDEATKLYEPSTPTPMHNGWLRTSVPFDMDIELTGLGR